MDSDIVAEEKGSDYASDTETESQEKDVELVDAALPDIFWGEYAKGCSETRKRTIRKNAKMFMIKDGVMHFKKRRKVHVPK